MNRRLHRSRTDSVIGGVAGGVAEYLDVDPSIVRIVWAILAFVTGGIFFVLYIVMWIVVPEGPPRGYAAGPMPPPPAEGGEPFTGETVATDQAAWEAPAAEPRRHRSSNVAPMIFGLLLIGLGAWFLLDEYIPWLDSDLLWPVGLVAIGIILLVVSMRRSSAAE